MRNITRSTLLISIIFTSFCLQAAPAQDPASAEPWSQQRCDQLKQIAQPDLPTQQQIQQHCSPSPPQHENAAVMPVQLDVQLPQTTPAPPAEPPPRIQHNSTLEWLGSSMLLVLLGFWLWMGRK